MAKTKIQWTDNSWNPVTGCSLISIGCQNCYAREMAATRLAGRCGYPEAPNYFKVTMHPGRLDYPMKLKKPSRIFVCSMSDLFHPDIPDSFRDQIFNVMAECPRHTFQLLTKRPHIAHQYLPKMWERNVGRGLLANIWLGVSASTQIEHDNAIHWLSRIVKSLPGNPTVFLSLEPLLETVHIHSLSNPYLMNLPEPYPDWIIAGAETGNAARPIELSAFRVLRDRCKELKIPFFLKQTDKQHDRLLDGRLHEEFPKERE